MDKMQIIDSHVHFLDQRLTYDWLKDCPSLRKNYGVTELVNSIQTCELSHLIFIQAECVHSQALNEVAWVSELAQSDKRIKGIVAFAPVEKGESVIPYLKELKKLPLVKGVRRLIQWEDDPNFCIKPDFIKGVQSLEDFNFSFDICIKEHQFPSVIQLVKQCPNIHFVLDHLGKPNLISKKIQPWASHIQTLAELPNVSCKISGLITEADPLTWNADDFLPYVKHAVSIFGFDRILYGSDWPVLNLASNYEEWLKAIHFLVQGLSAAQKHKFFYDNALKFYKVD